MASQNATVTSSSAASSAARDKQKTKIWWSNGIFFIFMHAFALYGVLYLSPLKDLDRRTAILAIMSWQIPCFGITLGYHRLWSHHAYEATLPLRIVLAALGSMGFQGSIKWWVLRHRLHHRFTDSPIHDPYAATKGLFYSHCGWIFLKPSYPRLRLIERDDLDSDPVVRFQHKHFLPIAILMGIAVPWAVAYLGWGDGWGGLVWGAIVARLGVWHSTFCINSLAHWSGFQQFTEDVSARGNLILALITSGEGNHNYHHAFPQDFRNGPHSGDWDPTKWIIWLLHNFTPLVPKIYRTPDSAIASAKARVLMAHADRLYATVPQEEREKPIEELPVWSRAEVKKRHGELVVRHVQEGDGTVESIRWRRLLLIVDGCIVDAGRFLPDHPGGKQLLLAHAVTTLPASHFDSLESSLSSPTSPAMSDSGDSFPFTDSGYTSGDHDDNDKLILRDATKAFFGGMNNHTGAAKAQMRSLRVARLADE
ncbi:hypothetical protein BD324DRAFT_647794 [Kockovaella imperatae]|uniref:Acyl-CoA desaturase n=1 Tax=Kockovaella imperatae TaxID=4999 RepID=A0A1Y1US87_9TREE|nr:hypothetical protein BD324DRAFT_647794 [Kockovaella imperatae]ORX40890.1 hypothetical protein BD324DRAFT_647794 [Kockovaella imperatae]